MKPWPDDSEVKAEFFDKSISLTQLKENFPAPITVVKLKQVHSNRVIIIRSQNLTELHDADATVTELPNVALTVHTADCLPLLAFAGNLLGACHGGWRGVSTNILEKWITTFQGLGAKREELQVAIGPSIGPCHFEVGKDVAQLLLQGIPEKFLPAFTRIHPDETKQYISLREIARFRLMRAGVLPQNILVSEDCTFCDQDRFYSYRRDGAQNGHRLEALIVKPHH